MIKYFFRTNIFFLRQNHLELMQNLKFFINSKRLCFVTIYVVQNLVQISLIYLHLFIVVFLIYEDLRNFATSHWCFFVSDRLTINPPTIN